MPSPYGRAGVAAPGSNLGVLGPAAADLGLGSMLVDQVVSETEEQRRRRMQQLQSQQQGAGGAMAATPSGQLASLALFGGGRGF